MDRIWQIDSFNGWESDDIIKWPANSFYQWENIEVRKNLSALQLAPLLTDTGWVFDDNISYMCNLETLWVENWGILVCLENWKIYLDWVLKTTFSTGTSAHDEIKWIGVNENLLWTQYVYYITKTSFGNGKIHRSTTDLATFNVSYREFTVASGNSGFVGVINDTGLMYLAINNKILLMEQDEIVQDFLLLPKQEVIAGFTQFQWKFKIYSNLINTWVQYTWDWISEAISYRQEWINQPILWVVNDWSSDYATLWFNENYSWLFQIQGTQKSKIRTNLKASNNSRILNKYLSIREGVIYISWGRTWQSNNYGVYTYWNYYPWTARSLIQSYSWVEKFQQHCHKDTLSYFATVDDKVYTISHNNPPSTYATSGYVVTNMYQGFIWEEKSFNYMKLWFKLNWWEIKIYARTDMWATWNLFKTIDNTAYWNVKSIRIDKNEVMESGTELWTLNEVQLKFELFSSAWGTNTPEVYQPTTWLTSTNTK